MNIKKKKMSNFWGLNGKNRYVNLYLPEEIVDKIDSIASKEERPRNFIIKKILEKHLEKKCK